MEDSLSKISKYYESFEKVSSVDVKQPIFSTDKSEIFDVTIPGPVDTMNGKEILSTAHLSPGTWVIHWIQTCSMIFLNGKY